MTKIHKAMVVAILAGGALAVPAPAQAAPTSTPSTASASLGEVDIVVGGTPAQAAPIAPCDVAGPEAGNSRGADVGTTTEYGRGETTCTRGADGVSSAKVTGQRFETSVLRQFGGPTIRVRTYTAECQTTDNGSSGYVELGGVSGFTMPSSIPPNHSITIPSPTAGDPPMAELVLNEFVAPTPPDGSLTTHALHIKLFPEGGPGSGDIYVGSASCDPYGG
ncbi:choice-of-anchor P family protein [Saccharomonospora sp. NPDC046836]|uniref:choice-of-anchor P family protein n=1 Tax=Saccharomonospora sp. NPDC046836 TaxID=3156921 RepID=UPI0033F70CC5